MKKSWLWMAGVLALAAGGCVKFDVEETLNADGTVDMKIHYAVSEQTAAQWNALRQQTNKQDPKLKGATQEPGLVFDEADIKAAFEKKEGVKLTSVRTETKDGWKHIYADVRFDDVGKASAIDPFDQKGGGLSLTKNQGGGLSLTKSADGNWVLESINGEREQKKPNPEEQAMVRAMMAGLSISVKVTVPGDIVETTAPDKEGRSATWKLDIADEKFFDKSEEFNKKGMKVVFKGAGLNLKEFKLPAPEKTPPADEGTPEPEAGGAN